MSMMRFQIVLIKPDGFEFVESFRETMEVLQECLAELGHQAQIQTNRIDDGAIPVLFGAHHVGPSGIVRLPADSIIFNLEQLTLGYPWFSERYLGVLSRFRVWDFSANNVDYLRRNGIAPTALHVPLGYSPCLTRIPAAEMQDVDVLFFGVYSERRWQVLNELANRGLKVAALSNVWGVERDRWIARAKVVVNIHQAETGQFEIARVLYLLANGKAVVSEANAEDDIDDEVRSRIVAVPYAGLVDACLALLQSDEARRSLQESASTVASECSLQALLHVERAVLSLE